MRSNSRLGPIVESIERLEARKAVIASMIAEQKSAAKGLGYSGKVLGEVLKRRKMSAAARDEHDALVNLYEAELGMLGGTPLGEAAIRRLERETKPGEPDPDLPFAEELSAEPAPAPEPAPPDDTEEQAREKGAQAAQDGQPITMNPYPARTPLRAAWDEAWCQAKGSDGMDLPDAWKPTPKPKKPKDGEDGGPEGGDE